MASSSTSGFTLAPMIFNTEAEDSSIQDRLRCALLNLIQSAGLKEHIARNNALPFESRTEALHNVQFHVYRQEKYFLEELLDRVSGVRGMQADISTSRCGLPQNDGKVLFRITIVARLLNQNLKFIDMKGHTSELEVQWRAGPTSLEMRAMRNWQSVINLLTHVAMQWFLPNGQHDHRQIVELVQLGDYVDFGVKFDGQSYKAVIRR